MSDDTKAQTDNAVVEVVKVPAADALGRLRTTPLIVDQFYLETIAPPEADAVTFVLQNPSTPDLALGLKLTCGASGATFQGWNHSIAINQPVDVQFVSVADFTAMDDNYPGVMIPCTITSATYADSSRNSTAIAFSSSGIAVPRQRTPSSVKFDYTLTAELTVGNHLLRTLIGTDRITQSTKFYLHFA